MVHRVLRTPEEKAAVESEGIDDPFIIEEEDPMQTRAIDSCLWEICQLQSHYHPKLVSFSLLNLYLKALLSSLPRLY
jgi:U3 small nucleolar RNA-associated protein 19